MHGEYLKAWDFDPHAKDQIIELKRGDYGRIKLRYFLEQQPLSSLLILASDTAESDDMNQVSKANIPVTWQRRSGNFSD